MTNRDRFIPLGKSSGVRRRAEQYRSAMDDGRPVGATKQAPHPIAIFEALENRRLFSVASGTEFLINTTIAGAQSATVTDAIAADNSGRFVTVWEGAGTGDLNGIFARVFDADGNPLTGEILVNQNVAGIQDQAAVAMDADGDFVVTWTDHNQPVQTIMLRRFNIAGTAQSNETFVDPSQLFTLANSSVAMDNAGNFVVVWQSNNQDFNSTDGIFAQRFNAAGVTQGAQFQVNSVAVGDQHSPDVIMENDSEFIIVFEGNGAGDSDGIFGRHYDASGVAIGVEFRANLTTAGIQTGASIATDGANFTIAWSGNGPGDTDGVFVQRYNTSGPIGPETLINSTIVGVQTNATVAISDDGLVYTIAWNGNGPGDAAGVFFRQFNFLGFTIVGETRVNSTTSNDQSAPAIAFNDLNDFIVTWSGDGAGDGSGVFGQLFVNTPPLLDLNGALGGADTTVAFTEGAGAVDLVATDATVIENDLGFGIIDGMVVTISNLLDGAFESLTADTSGTLLIGIYDSGTGELTFSGSSDLNAYQQVLRTIQYENTSDNPSTTSRVIEFVTNDRIDDSPIATATVGITAVGPIDFPPADPLIAFQAVSSPVDRELFSEFDSPFNSRKDNSQSSALTIAPISVLINVTPGVRAAPADSGGGGKAEDPSPNDEVNKPQLGSNKPINVEDLAEADTPKPPDNPTPEPEQTKVAKADIETEPDVTDASPTENDSLASNLKPTAPVKNVVEIVLSDGRTYRFELGNEAMNGLLTQKPIPVVKSNAIRPDAQTMTDKAVAAVTMSSVAVVSAGYLGSCAASAIATKTSADAALLMQQIDLLGLFDDL